LLVWGRLPKSLKDTCVRALGTYKDFLILWKGADADITILKQAKAEYAKRVLSSTSSGRVKVPLAPK